ncbi:pilus assembly protein TadG-related protein [Bradyrhizobium sp. dw_411]|uniref:TadE/TadG family type IV pilus assembly protein n=1 Tax=Bradyrhizobium sp. dw_411 TaxID=2720082 RepID=UPI001BCFD304|nr:pilus assembly protein TadG-related protein [Bradyrhizobium sp. dw_411]
MAKAGFAGCLTSLTRRFRGDSRGNIAVTFALALLPVLSAIGCATDYSLASRMKAKMQSAADAAAVASISKNSAGYLAASTMTGNGSIAAGLTDANNLFCGNLNVANATSGTGCNTTSTTEFGNLSLAGTTVKKTGIVLNSVVNFSATVPVVFMKVLGYQTLTITGVSKATASLPPYLDFYLMLDLSGSMGLPSTNDEQTRLSNINPDDFSVYPNGCTFACHFQSSGSCSDPARNQTTNVNGSAYSAYPTNNYCLGYLISRVSQTGYAGLLQSSSNYPMKGKQFPSSLLTNLTASLTGNNSIIAGNSKSASNALTPVTSCPTAGTDACIQLRADAVGTALNATVASGGVDGLFATANKKMIVSKQFRIGLYPFIRNLITYVSLTDSINNSPTASGTINYAAANLATLLDTGNTPDLGLGSGGTHFDNAFQTMNTTITSVGDGSSPTNTQPFVFLVTDGAQNFQTCCGFSGSNAATVMPSGSTSWCKPLRDRGIIISVLYIPYQTIQNPTTIFNNEDNVANANIANIPASLKDCASVNFFFTANTPADITTALAAMFNQALQVAHITN